MHLHMIKYGLKIANYELVFSKLRDLKDVSSKIKISFIKDSYEDGIKLVNKFMEDKFKVSK